MLSVTKMSGSAEDAEAASRYLDDTQENTQKPQGAEDYYLKDSSSTQWHGSERALEVLGIDPDKKPTQAEMKALMLGINPTTGEKIVKSGEERTFGYDLTFSAPKSVSMEWQLNPDEAIKQRIQEAHDNAVKKAMDEAYKLIGSRAGAGGAEKISDVETISTLHRHGTSRELDMQLHTHGFLFNAALCPDGSFRTITTNDLYRHKMLLGAVYRAELAKSMKEIGYSIEADKDSFKLGGVSTEAEKHFSKRAEQINEYTKEHGITSPVGMQMARLATRTGKKELSPEELNPLWQAQAAEIGYKSPELIREQQTVIPYDRAEFIKTVTSEHSVLNEIKIMRKLVVAMQHAGRDFEDAKAELKDLTQSSDLVILKSGNDFKGGTLYSTQTQIDIEKSMIETAQAMRSSTAQAAEYQDHLKTFEVNHGYSLSDEQAAAVAEMTRAGQLSLVRGVAGAGKTTAAEVAYKAFNAQGRQVIGLAIAAKAARGLKDATDSTTTIAGFLLKTEKTQQKIKEFEELLKQPAHDKQRQGQQRELARLKATLPNSNTVLMFDEAGMISSKDMQKVLSVAKEYNSKVILIGDEKQLQAIEAGGAFLAIQKYAIDDKTEITEIRRQKSEAGKAISRAFETGKVNEGFRILDNNGLIQFTEDKKQALQGVVDSWASNKNEGISIKENLMLAALKKDVAELNKLARVNLGLEGFGYKVQTESGVSEFTKGDRVIFKKNQKQEGLTNGDLGIITSIEKKVSEDKEKPGDYYLITVKRDLDDTEVTVNTQEYGHLEYGYAITTHAAQGVTVERSSILATTDPLSNQQLGYVQMSRQKGDSQNAGLNVTAYCELDDEDIFDKDGNKKSEDELRAARFNKIVTAYGRNSEKETTLDYTMKDEKAEQEEPEQE